MSARFRERISRDEGLTLIELLVATMLTGVIVTVLFASFQLFYTNSSYTSGRDDHSAGGSVLASWLDRDLASGTSATIATGSKCAGTNTKTLTIKWFDYAPAAGQPADSAPVAAASPYVVTYDIQADTTTAGACMVRRTYTPASGTPSSLILAHSLKAADFSAASTGTCGDTTAPGTPLTVTIKHYGSDVSAGYTYQGCLKGRTNALT
jgi:Tfp pilus assembly protein PilE